MGRQMGRERERAVSEKMGSEKMGWERERACVYNKRVGWGNNKKIKKIDYLNKRGDKIDELVWVFCKSECVK